MKHTPYIAFFLCGVFLVSGSFFQTQHAVSVAFFQGFRGVLLFIDLHLSASKNFVVFFCITNPVMGKKAPKNKTYAVFDVFFFGQCEGGLKVVFRIQFSTTWRT